jgi:hypothetical protein
MRDNPCDGAAAAKVAGRESAADATRLDRV